MLKDFDMQKLEGVWMSLYEERGINKQVKCVGNRLDAFASGTLAMSATALLSDRAKEKARAEGAPEDKLNEY